MGLGLLRSIAPLDHVLNVFKHVWLKVVDGDHPLEPIEDHPTSLRNSTSTKEVKEVHAMV